MKPAAFLHALALAFTVGLTGCATAQARDKPMLIDELPSPTSKTPNFIKSDEYTTEQAALRHRVDVLLKDQYKVVGQRFFINPVIGNGGTMPGVSVVSGVDYYASDKLKGKIEFRIGRVVENDKSATYITIWKTGLLHAQRFALAMAPDNLPDGSELCGYFEVEKE